MGNILKKGIKTIIGSVTGWNIVPQLASVWENAKKGGDGYKISSSIYVDVLLMCSLSERLLVEVFL